MGEPFPGEVKTRRRMRPVVSMLAMVAPPCSSWNVKRSMAAGAGRGRCRMLPGAPLMT